MNKTLILFIFVFVLVLLTLLGFKTNKTAGKLTLIGHSSVKIVTADNLVIYIDPFFNGDYSEPADIILVTHEHSDHNKIDLVTKKDTTKIIRSADAIKDGNYQNWKIDGMEIQAVSAYNKNHQKNACVGYILKFNDISLYHAGDTDITEEMPTLKKEKLTYAMFPTDGIYNMNAQTATNAANIVGAKYNIPIHTSANNTPHNQNIAQEFTPKGALILSYGQSIQLVK